MRTRPDRASCLGVLLSLMIVTAAMACRYTVRDIGFVRLSPPNIRLVLLDAVHDDAAIASSLADLPLELVEVDSSHDPSHPACIALQDTGRSAVLLDENGRALPIEDPLSIGRTPLAMTLAADASTTFAFVLLLESPDEQSNAIARAELDQLQGRLDAIEEHLPRPLGHPLRIRSLDAEQQARESALLWSLGVDLPVEAPVALVTYGRARRAGQPVLIDAGTRDDAARELIAQLALVGESCECDTSRAWTVEPVGLVPWTRETHAIASGALGFDSESPMVRAEVIRILGKSAERTDRDDRPDTLEELLLGYGETTLDPVVPAPEGPPASGPGDTRSSPKPPVRIVDGSDDDDWSFDDEVEEPTSVVSVASGTDAPPSDPGDGDSRVSTSLMWLVTLVGASFLLAFLVVRKMEGRS